ncbi:hypothetical protein Tco_1381882 [Tanacetum coccineum]
MVMTISTEIAKPTSPSSNNTPTTRDSATTTLQTATDSNPCLTKDSAQALDTISEAQRKTKLSRQCTSSDGDSAAPCLLRRLATPDWLTLAS